MQSARVSPDRVAVYIRWSTEDQGQGHTLEIQRDSCRYYALSQGWTVSADLTFIDDGYSGSTLERPALGRLRRAVQERRVECVVVYKLDRLSRNIKDIINLVLGEWEQICCVRSTQEPVDTTTDAGKMFFTMLGSFADFERATIRTRTWSGKLKAAEKGRNPGIVYPYGYRKSEDGGYATDETEAPLVKEIYDLYLQGRSCGRIAKELNRRGLPTRQGRGWSCSIISKILRNPIYMGRLVYNRRSGAPVVVENAVPALIEPDAWKLAGSIRSSRPRVNRAGSPRNSVASFLLTGLVTCTCGARCSGAYGTKGEQYYYCGGAQTKGRAICPAGMIPAAVLDDLVMAQVRQTWPLKPALRADILLRLDEQAEQHRLAVGALQRRLDALEKSLRRFREDYRTGKLSADLLRDLTEETRQERELVKQQLQAAEGAMASIESSHLELDQAAAWYARLDAWDSLDSHERKQVLSMLIARVVAFRSRRGKDLSVEIAWRLTD